MQILVPQISDVDSKACAVYFIERVLDDVKEGDLVISTDGSAASASGDVLSYKLLVHYKPISNF